MSNRGKKCKLYPACANEEQTDWTQFTMDEVASRYGMFSNNAKGVTVGILAWAPQNQLGVDLNSIADWVQSVKGVYPNFEEVLIEDQINIGENTAEIPMDCKIMGYFCAEAAQINVYFAEESTAHLAIQQAADDGCSITTCSFSIQDIALIENIEKALCAATSNGMVTCFAAGDTGPLSGQIDSVVYPAGSPYATAVGGTFVPSSGSEEVVWWNYPPDNSGGHRCWWASGGGVSSYFNSVPAFQSNLNPAPISYQGNTGRGVPDLACMAEGMTPTPDIPDSGFFGTSAASPTFASLLASICSQLKSENISSSLSNFQQLIYNPPSEFEGKLFNFVNTGNSVPPSCTGSSIPAYNAVENSWDCCTGLGTPNGEEIYQMFKQVNLKYSG